MVRHYLLSALFLLTTAFAFAQYNVQSKYFVYLQTEPAQSFYVKIGGQNLNANASGYLILPQIKNGDYKLVVGFPESKVAEQTFNFKIDGKDKGYLIKDFGAEGVGLFDLQTMAVQKPVNPATEVAKAEVPKQEAPKPQAENVSDFTKVLSKATNDPTLLEEKPKPEPVVEKPKPAPVAEVKPEPKKEEPAVVVTKPEEKPVVEEKPAVVQNNNSNTSPRVVRETADGVEMVYIDKGENGSTEEIDVVIPVKKTEQPKVVVAETPAPKQAEQQPAPAEEKKQEKFVVEEKPPVTESNTERQEVAQKVSNSANCKKLADEDDFLKLRRQMAQRDNDDQMINEAQKAFKAKCYSTAQVKYLSSMFLSNAGKFNFYQSAIGHIADPENFASLRSELKDDYYIGKFDGLIGH